MLLESASDAKSGCALLHGEHRDAMAATGLASLGSHEIEVAMHPVGDEHLGAVQPIAAFDLARAGAHGGQVGARVRFRHGHRRDLSAGGDVGHPARQLLGRTGVIEMRGGHVGVHQHRHGKAAVSAAAQFLGQHDIGERIEPGAAMLGRIAHAEQAERAHLAQHLARHAALLLPGIAAREDFVGDEAPQGLPQHGVLLAEIGEAVGSQRVRHDDTYSRKPPNWGKRLPIAQGLTTTLRNSLSAGD